MNNLQLSVLLNAIDKMSAPLKSASKSVSELSKKLKENKNVRAQLSKAERENEAAIKKYAATINPLKNKLSALNNEVAKAKQKADLYTNQLNSAKNPTEQFKNKVLAAQQAVKKLTAEQIATANKLKQTRQELNAAGLSSKTLAQRQSELKSKMSAANQQINNQSAALSKLNAKQAAYNRYRGKVDNLKDINSKVQIVGAQALAAGATITAPLVGSVRDFMSFEDAMVGVARQVQGLKDDAGNFTSEFEQWKLNIQDLSKELPLTTVQIANMIESAARMDVPKEQLAEFVRLNTQMATAFDAANPDELVEQYGKVTKNFKLSAQASRELADAINYLDDNAISKGTEIIGFMNRVSGISGIANISEKNMAALGSTLQTAGAAEEQSATAVNAIFTRLSQASKKKPVKNGLAALGLSANAVELGMVKDAQGTIFKIVDALKKLPESKRLGTIADLVGTEHTKTLALLVSNTEEWRRQIELANSEAAKGSMGREFDTRMKALSSKWGIFKNRLFNINSVIGGTLAPTLERLMDKIGGVIDRIKNWIIENPKLTSNIVMIAGAIGGALTIFGALSTVLSFVLYPIARLGLALANLGVLLPRIGGAIVRGLLSPLKFVGLALSPIGAAIIAAGIAIFKYWQPISSFFSGFLSGLQSGLQPVIDKFKPLVGWIESAFNWFTNLLAPVQSTKEDLDAAANAGKKFGEWLAAGIDLVTKPLQWLMDSIKWVLNNLPTLEGIGKTIDTAKQKVSNATANAMNNSAAGSYFMTGAGLDAPNVNRWSGGYAGNGGKYEPKGIFHGGEYIMTKEATSRLGVATLNALNYGKQALIAGGLGIGLATAAPIQVDNRPPISARPSISQTMQPMAVNITINAQAGQNERQIAQLVAAELERINRQQQARMRSRMTDRA
ncbi:predicted phage-related tail protein [Haemophilus parainfluenzae T3T1]|uniref:Predicted phage-related tail protein n=1 Tax=Haemophilus parainfluenzae (strain T3T1) TaxID=862965 RepID=A0AB33QJD4_HAEP3|nr:phage tail tape measure protein [Haemophilus parainfluenzae]CBW14520.1 predicted phage-related tail protein [Haemophilus parainfluenzae T3T1]